MLLEFLHRIVAHPLVYDMVQYMAGVAYVRKRLRQRIAPLKSASLVVDLGGGTGIDRKLWAQSSNYICMDIDLVKVQGFLGKFPEDIALIGDAADMPFKSDSIDVVVCKAVAHHLTDAQLEGLVREANRVLKSTGVFVLLDPVWKSTRWPGRFLWKLDRGSNPRTTKTLTTAISSRFKIESRERFAVFHEYALFVAKKRVSGTQ